MTDIKLGDTLYFKVYPILPWYKRLFNWVFKKKPSPADRKFTVAHVSSDKTSVTFFPAIYEKEKT